MNCSLISPCYLNSEDLPKPSAITIYTASKSFATLASSMSLLCHTMGSRIVLKYNASACLTQEAFVEENKQNHKHKLTGFPHSLS